MLPEDVKVRLPDGQTVVLKTLEDSAQTFYINNASFSMTQWDVSANLNEILATKVGSEASETAVIEVSRKVKIIMNVGYAKQFAQVLLRHVEQHENIGKQAAEIATELPATPSESETDKS